MSKKRDKGRLPPFILVFVETANAPAFKMLSFGARWLFMGLQSKHSNDGSNNGRLFLSQRDAGDWLGHKNRNDIANWFRELEHYGFIVKTSGASLGVEGRGKAPHWRLTDRPARNGRGELELATKDFLRWDGDVFEPHRASSKRWNADKTAAIKKQNPGLHVGTTVDSTSVPVVDSTSVPPNCRSGTNGESISANPSGTNGESISSLTTPLPTSGRIIYVPKPPAALQ
jgi:hypothetical protein